MNLNLFEAEPALIKVNPVLDCSVRGLCAKPYPLHPKGCPNRGKSNRCPPTAPLFEEVFDRRLVFAIINEFDLAGHVARMAKKHPNWSDRQLRCVLYWQGTARKQLRVKIDAALARLHGFEATWCPEGMGVNVTATMEAAGISLEWPPEKIARQVAFLARPKGFDV